MNTEQPEISKTSRYSISETCKILGIHRNSLRKYTEQGLIKCGFRKTNLRKFYTGTEILAFWRAKM